MIRLVVVSGKQIKKRGIKMKKIILSAMLCGGMLLGVANSGVAHAADKLTGNTTATATVTKGDVTLDIDSAINFDPQPLSGDVNFGSQDVNYKVTDYSGDTKGYQLSAKLGDTDATRTVKIGDTTLSDSAAVVASKDSNIVGENADKLSVSLEYNGIKEVKDYSTAIQWNLTKTQTEQITE